MLGHAVVDRGYFRHPTRFVSITVIVQIAMMPLLYERR